MLSVLASVIVATCSPSPLESGGLQSQSTTDTVLSVATPDRRHEPPGFERIAEHDFSCMPGTGCAKAGVWKVFGKPENLTLREDPTAVMSPNGIVRIKFPAGLEDGGAPTRFDGWGPSMSSPEEVAYEQVYVSVFFRVDGTAFQNQSVGTKVFYMAYGSTMRSNHSALFLDGHGPARIMQEFTPSYYIYEMRDDGSDAGGGAIKRVPNVIPRNVRAGEWVHVEALFKINEIRPTRDNGVFQMWINGVQTHDLQNIRWRSDINPLGFYHFQFTPIWGGNAGEIRTRDDSWSVDNVYISAK
jgi:hypothetical protein